MHTDPQIHVSKCLQRMALKCKACFGVLKDTYHWYFPLEIPFKILGFNLFYYSEYIFTVYIIITLII